MSENVSTTPDHPESLQALQMHSEKQCTKPFAFASPEWSNEKGIDAALGFRLNGISSYHCVEAPIHGSSKVIEFLKEGTKETLHSSMVVDVDPVSLGEKMVADMKEKRRQLGI